MATKRSGARTGRRASGSRESSKRKQSRGMRIFMGIVCVVAVIAAALLLILEFCTSYKPSNGFKKQESEQTEQTTFIGAGNEPFAANMGYAGSAAARRKVSTYAETETVTPSCEHLPKTIESSDGFFTLTLSKASNTSCHVGFSDPVISRERDYVDTESVHYAEYTHTYQYSPSVFHCYKVGIWCIHDFRSYCIQEYGYFYSNLRYNIASCQNSMSAWQSSGVNPVTTESYDSTSGILTINVEATLKGQSSENYLPLYFDSYGLAPDGFLFYGSQTKYLPPDPVKEGYTFTGWYTNEACTNRYFASEVTSDITLYAGWQINTYTLTLKGNGGEISQTTISGDYNTIPEIPTPTRTGYNFLGWKTSDGTMYDLTAPLTQDITLTAQWEIKRFTVTFMVDGVVYNTMTVEYGTKLAQVTQSAEPNLFALYAVDSEGASLAGDYAIDGDITVHAEKGTTAQKLQGNWKRIAICAACGIVVLAVICCIPAMVRKRR